MIDVELVDRIHRTAVGLVVSDGSVVDVEQLVRHACPLVGATARAEIVAAVRSRMSGLGSLEPLLADDSVTDVLVNGAGVVHVERAGRLADSGVRISPDELALLIERVVAPLGRRVDRSQPFADARLPNGCRVHVAVPPVAVDGPYLTIRRFRTRSMSIEDFGCEPAERLFDAVRGGSNIIVSGGTGAGKTTLLNALAAAMSPETRVVTIEDAAELRLDLPHVVRLEARPANAEASGEVPIRELVRQALRMRPDRLILGEVRGAEAYDMVQAMNTGHDGSMTTCHANGPEEALDRVAALVQQAGFAWPVEAVRAQLLATVDLVVHVERGPGGCRSVTQLLEPGDLCGS